MIKDKLLYKQTPKGYTRYYSDKNRQIDVCVYGLFDSLNIKWEYYVVSLFCVNSWSSGANYWLTDDISNRKNGICKIGEYAISSYGRCFPSLDDAKVYVDKFKTCWETSLNIDSQEMRDKKLKELIS